jgi:RimJ/RimL family protein N-acetyltransferase
MLIGAKVCLGPVLNGDAPALFNWVDSPDIALTNGSYRPADEAKFIVWLTGFGSDPTRVFFAIRRQGDLRLLGYVQITNIHPILRSAEIGIAIGNAEDRGQGFGLEAVRMAVDYCWRDLNLQRVSLSVLSNNPGARHVYGKAGFKVEGTLRYGAYANGQFHDLTLMAILRADDEVRA